MPHPLAFITRRKPLRPRAAERRVRLAVVGLLVLLIVILAGVAWRVGMEQSSALALALDRGVLRVATLNTPTTYYMGREGPAGFEHDLIEAYAASAGLTVEFVIKKSEAEVLAALDAGEADIGAAGLVVTPARAAARRFTAPYLKVADKVVCRAGKTASAARADLLSADILIAEGAHHLAALEAATGGKASLSWVMADGANGQETLASVSEGETACTVVDARAFALARRYLPRLEEAAELPGGLPAAWAVAGGASARGESLAAHASRWLSRRAARRLVAALEEKYFGFLPDEIDDRHAAAFRAAIERKLPTYEALFRKEGEAAGVPWTLLAAVAYQESRWDPKAKSPTGVRGMMMITLPTARELGVVDRTDATQSTRAGARYLVDLKKRLPASIPEDDRWWFALAAYNQGYGSLLDARQLAAERGRNPDRWADVRDVLPLLEDPSHYKRLPHGYARGREAKIYVRRIRDYADVLEKRFAPPIPQAYPAPAAAPS